MELRVHNIHDVEREREKHNQASAKLLSELLKKKPNKHKIILHIISFDFFCQHLVLPVFAKTNATKTSKQREKKTPIFSFVQNRESAFPNSIP